MPRKTAPADPATGDVPLDDELAALLMRWMAMSMQAGKGKGLRAMLALQTEHGLSSAMVVVMHIVAFDGAQTMTALSERTGLSTSAMSHLLQRLVQRGVMVRSEDPGDRRIKHMALTDKGRGMLSAIVRERFDDLRSSVSSISLPTKLALRGVMSTVVDELGASAGCPAAVAIDLDSNHRRPASKSRAATAATPSRRRSTERVSRASTVTSPRTKTTRGAQGASREQR